MPKVTFWAAKHKFSLTDHDPGLMQFLAQLRLAGRDPTQAIHRGHCSRIVLLGEAISPTIWSAASIAVDNMGNYRLKAASSARGATIGSTRAEVDGSCNPFALVWRCEQQI